MQVQQSQSGAPAEWTRFLDDEANRLEVAASVMALLLHPNMWVSRRTEEVDFVDDRTVSRQVTVCYEVPPVAHGFEMRPGRTALFPPLALLGKGLVRHLVVTNGAGERIPMLNRRDSQEIASTMLRELARSVLDGEALDPDVDGWLDGIATGEPAEAKRLVDAVRIEPEGSQAHRLWTEPRTQVLIQDLAEKFVFIVPCFDVKHFDEGIVIYSYEEALTTDRSHSPGAAVRLGWRPMPIAVKLPAIGLARTCDVDIRVPDDLCIREASVTDLRNGRRIAHDEEPSRTAHLYVEDAERGTYGTAGLELYAQAGGFSWSALAAAALATMILAAGALWADSFAASAEPASAMLLGVPAILAGYLIRPGEHGLVQRAVWGLRAALGVTVIVSVLAILALVAGLGADGRQIWFGVSAAITALATGAVAIALVSAIRSARRAPQRQTFATDSAGALPAVRFPDAFLQQGVELKGLWTGGPEGFLAAMREPIEVGRTVQLLYDMRSRLPQPQSKNGNGSRRFGRDGDEPPTVSAPP